MAYDLCWSNQIHVIHISTSRNQHVLDAGQSGGSGCTISLAGPVNEVVESNSEIDDKKQNADQTD
uniref:Uncharacterized protein n=1 Tax=Macrostomum lignano TaxID=282301 RepID=A0A1I8JHI5_9PLAT